MRRHLASHAGDGASLLPCRCAAALLRRVCHANGLRCRRYHCRQRRWWRCRRRVRMCEPACVKQDNRALTNASRRCPLHAAACAQRGAARSDAARAARGGPPAKAVQRFGDVHTTVTRSSELEHDDTPRTRAFPWTPPHRCVPHGRRRARAAPSRPAPRACTRRSWQGWFWPSSNARGVRAAPRVAARTRTRSHGCGRPVPAARTRVGPLLTPPARPLRDAHLRLEPRDTTAVPDAPDRPRAPQPHAGADTRWCARGAGRAARRGARAWLLRRARQAGAGGLCTRRAPPRGAAPAAALWRV
jgi:hypothetical protein